VGGGRKKKGELFMTKNIKKTVGFLFIMVFCTIIATWIPQVAKAAKIETFSGVEGKSGDLRWYITKEGHLFITGEGDYKLVKIKTSLDTILAPEWVQYRDYIRTAQVEVKNITSTNSMFSNCESLTALSISKFDTSNVTNMDNMFSNCCRLTSLNLNGFNTSNVTNMDNMFSNCCRLTSLNLNGFNTSNVTSMNNMFSDCQKLTDLDISQFDTSNVTDMSYMFFNCQNLTSLDLSNFDTNNVTNMESMFNSCKNLTSLDVSKFNTNNVTNMAHMFEFCRNLTGIDVNNFNTSKVTNMNSMFSRCFENLTSIDVSNFDTSNVTDMNSMFFNCGNVTSINVSNFNTSNVTDMGEMFSGCDNLTSIDVSNFDTSNVTNMDKMFCYCENLTSLDVRGFNTSNVTSMNSMFFKCENLTSLDVSGFDTSNVTDMNSMFYGCGLTSIDVSGFDTSNVTDMDNMFCYCKLTSLDVSNFDTSNVTALSGLFSNASKLVRIDLFANTAFQCSLPGSPSRYQIYYWINENYQICTETAKLDRKMTYIRVDKNGNPIVIPTPIPTPIPTQLPTSLPSTDPDIPSDTHIFTDYSYSNPVTDNNVVIYGNGTTKKIDGKKVNNRVATVYTDILASYKYKENNGIVKPSAGKVIVAVTKSTAKPTISNKNKVTDTSASKMTKAKIKDGKITINAVGKEGGSAYLWVIDTGNEENSACCPVNVKLAPKKLEIQSTSGSKLAKNTELKNGGTLEVCVAGFVGSAKTEDGTYTATVSPKYSNYVNIAPVAGSTNKFTVTAKGLKNDKKTKVAITFICDQNNKKTKQSLVITK